MTLHSAHYVASTVSQHEICIDVVLAQSDGAAPTR